MNNEIIDIGLSEFDLNTSNDFDFLSNRGSSSSSSGGGRLDLDSLEQELNNLSDVRPNMSSQDNSSSGGGGGGFFSSFLGGGNSEPKIGQASAEYLGENATTKTWDGYSKVNDASFSNATPASGGRSIPSREQNRKKRSMLKRLEELSKKGSITGLSVNADSSYEEIEDEYNGYMEEKLKHESIKLQKQWFFNGINTLELVNSTYDPFGMDLTGWGEKMAEDLEDDDEVFGELYEKYKGGKLAPEVKLLLKIATSAFWISLTNRMISASVPAMGDVIRQNPEVMKTFMSATVDTLSSMPEMKGNPMMNFAQDMMHKDPKPDMKHGPPPAPVETRDPASQSRKPAPIVGKNMQYTQQTPAFRPDLDMARSGGLGNVGSHQESGVEINQSFGSLSKQEYSVRPPTRPEMKGPSSVDLDNILAGLKQKEDMVSKSQQAQQYFSAPQQQQPVELPSQVASDDSLISISSLKELANQQMPKKGRGRRNKSDKNNSTIVLDI